MARPNVVLVLVDDMGFSDIGCYGGEIDTPHIDRLARDGVRFSQFYNTARCSPSRASLLTGLHPHQTGIGVLTNDDRPRGYPGTINERCVTIAEVLKAAGYATCLSGKWHLASEMRTPNDAWPTRRGFDRFFGTLTGLRLVLPAGHAHARRDERRGRGARPGLLLHRRDHRRGAALHSRAPRRAPRQPFFLYIAYTAPHWPLHARDEDVAKYRGVFDEGWDVLRERRMRRLRGRGHPRRHGALSERDPTQPAWSDAEYKEWQVRRMEVYAAQIDRMDKGVGRILADARGSRPARRHAGDLPVRQRRVGRGPAAGRARALQAAPRHPAHRRRGTDARCASATSRRSCRRPEDTYASYGRAWANLSNTPFRYYKRFVHEGGIATPFIVRWPGGKLARERRARAVPAGRRDADDPRGDRRRIPRSATGTRHHAVRRAQPAARACAASSPDGTLYWEHTGNAAIRRGRWKLVRDYPEPWELYDLEHDRTELHDLAAAYPDVVRDLAARWQAWADRVGVLPWPVTEAIYAERGLPPREALG